MMNSQHIWHSLTSHQKLERDRGVETLQQMCDKATCNSTDNVVKTADQFGDSTDEKLLDSKESSQVLKELFQKFVEYPISQKETPWETKIGILLGCRILVEAVACCPSLPGVHISTDVDALLRSNCLNLLSDEEVRVRLAAAELLGALAKVLGIAVYEDSKERIMDLIKLHMERDDINEPSIDPPRGSSTETFSTSNTSQQIFHETAGWRNLETSIKCLQYVIQGCGHSFLGSVDSNLLELIYTTTRHTNRFVRETGYHTLASIIEVASGDESTAAKLSEAGDIEAMETDKTEEWDAHSRLNPVTSVHGISLSTVLSEGLSDNWSQVSMNIHF